MFYRRRIYKSRPAHWPPKTFSIGFCLHLDCVPIANILAPLARYYCHFGRFIWTHCFTLKFNLVIFESSMLFRIVLEPDYVILTQVTSRLNFNTKLNHARVFKSMNNTDRNKIHSIHKCFIAAYSLAVPDTTIQCRNVMMHLNIQFCAHFYSNAFYLIAVTKI